MAQLSKSSIRKTILQYRQLLPEAEFRKRNNQLLENLKVFLLKTEFQSIHTFLPIKKNKEVDVKPLMPWLWENEKKVIISKSDFERQEMNHFFFQEDTVLEENKIGIPEPINAKSALFEDVDVILVPLLISDKIGNRIGYGGGFYDRLLVKTKALKIGLSLSSLADELDCVNEWDVTLDYVINSSYQL